MTNIAHIVTTDFINRFKRTAKSMRWFSFTTGAQVSISGLYESLFKDIVEEGYRPLESINKISDLNEVYTKLQAIPNKPYKELIRDEQQALRYLIGDFTEWIAKVVLAKLKASSPYLYQIYWTKQFLAQWGISKNLWGRIDQCYGDLWLVLKDQKQIIFLDWKTAITLLYSTIKWNSHDLDWVLHLKNIGGGISYDKNPESLKNFGKTKVPEMEAFLNQTFFGYKQSFIYVCASARSEVLSAFDADCVRWFHENEFQSFSSGPVPHEVFPNQLIPLFNQKQLYNQYAVVYQE